MIDFGRIRSFNYDSLGRLLDATNPESGRIDYDYDANGNVLTSTLARTSNGTRVVVTNTYDALNRITGKTYNDTPKTPPVSYCYDGQTYGSESCSGAAITYSIGQRTSVGNSVSSTNYTHDDQGRVSQSTQTVGTPWSFSYEYYADDSLALTKLPGGKSHVTCYDSNGRPKWVSSQLAKTDCSSGTAPSTANVYAWVETYTPQGAIEELRLGTASNYRERWCYNAGLQVMGMRMGSAATLDCAYQAGDLLGLSLSYVSAAQANNNGNIMQQYIRMRKSLTDATEIRLRQDYRYDEVNRIKYAQEFVEAGTGSGWQRDWSYDAFGNVAVSGASLPAGAPLLLSQYEAATNRLKYYDSLLTKVINYDEGGNVIDRPADIGSGRTTYAYDADNRLTKVCQDPLNSSTSYSD